MSANAVYHLTRLMPRNAQGSVQSCAATAPDTLMSFAKPGASGPPGPPGKQPAVYLPGGLVIPRHRPRVVLTSQQSWGCYSTGAKAGGVRPSGRRRYRRPVEAL